ncbi:nitroreductase family protein [Coraliomargarita sp. SDUM461003]|uniref:Nitroreductase family protein n=1 Tax=Thalassobacterium maritimum TaxID=3041265 RepID=A0ABU1AY77_9BACT|nr:nitroreductase family protein [Coraliomargarita sp. SDUM461003]MDQ8209108.1 nitroreductase family protein [Coraliomargarita sp. SDUM461003]
MIELSPSILENRVTSGRFDPSATLDSTSIRELVRLATQAPSAFHLQNWSFIAVHSDAAKQQLMDLSYGQRQVRDAAVTFIVAGHVCAYESLAERLQPSVDVGIIDAVTQQTWVDMATGSHEGNVALQRDEAIRSASLAAMSLIVAARERGLDTGVLGGFDAAAVCQTFALSADAIPVMLVTVGRAAAGNWPQKVRRPLDEVLRCV